MTEHTKAWSIVLEMLAHEWLRVADKMTEIEDDGYAAARRDSASELLTALTAIGRKPMTKHTAMPAWQVSYPGGKDGMWRAACSRGDYVSSFYGSAAGAERAARQHADTKNAQEDS